MKYREFLEMRRGIMEQEMDMASNAVGRAFWKGRMLSYQDALSAVDGTTLLRAPEKGGNIKVEAAT